MNHIKYVYVAGKMSGPVVEYLSNCRRMNQHAYELLQLGYVPFDPALDYHFAMSCGPMAIEKYYDYSLAWLARCDAMIVDPEGADESEGVRAEIEFARERGIPVFRGKTWDESVAMLRRETQACSSYFVVSQDAQSIENVERELSSLVEHATAIIRRMLFNSKRLGKHPPWSWLGETVDEHIGKSIGHLNEARMQRDGVRAKTSERILDNAVMRALMASCVEECESTNK